MYTDGTWNNSTWMHHTTVTARIGDDAFLHSVLSVSRNRAEIMRLPVDPAPTKLAFFIDSGLQFR